MTEERNNNSVVPGIRVIFRNLLLLRRWWKKYRTHFKWEERHAYVMLAALAIACGAASVLISFHQIQVNNQNFCDILTITTPVAKPANPAANPSRERSYEAYLKARRLSHKLGCD